MRPIEKRIFADDRKSVAKQVRKARELEMEKEEPYKMNRSGKEYLYGIGGLKNLFEYLRSLPSHKILDVGTGNGNAINKISKMPISADLDFEITALHNSPELRRNFQIGKVHIATIETLERIEQASFAGIIGAISVAYSDSPILAVRKVDQVLTPGGVFKSTFNRPGKEEKHRGTSLKDAERFMEGFSALGYDISLIRDNSFSRQGRLIPIITNSILLAIKPGNPSAPSAEKLLYTDFESLRNDSIRFIGDVPVFDTEDK